MRQELLQTIDELIENAHQLNEENYLSYLTRFSGSILSYLQISFEKPILLNKIISKDLSPSHQNFVALSFLRLMSKNICLVEQQAEFKQKLVSLFDRNFQSLYQALKISEKDASYVKFSKLTDYIKLKEKGLSESLAYHGEIEFIGKYENQLFKTIKHRENSPLLENFADVGAFQQKFSKIFSLVKSYLQADNNSKFEIYNNNINALDILIHEMSQVNTKYARDYFVVPFSKIKQQIEADFLTQPASKPAILCVEPTEKKHPFHEAGIKNRFALRINNKNSGSAFDVTVSVKDSSDLIIPEKKQFIGTIVFPSVNIEFDYEVLRSTSSSLIEGEITWANFDGKECKEEFYFELEGQKAQLHWEQLTQLSPYDLEPVDKENELIGRDNILNQLRARIRNKLGSSYVFGQRRVGKTSVVKTLQTIEKNTDNLHILYIEAGDWSDATGPLKSMDNLGKKICLKIKRSSNKFNSVTVPDFKGSLSQISDFLDEITEIDEDFRMSIILDEFDRISNELFKRNDIGQSFMLTLRAISNRPQFGFILVGGEKLEFILSQWQEFNKFKPVRIDYFDKQQDWDDFKKLVKEPVSNLLEFNDKAIDYIYSQTSGNPYFTKLICIELFRYMVSNRDNHVTEREAQRATESARNSSNIAATDFSHFWEDGIKEKAEKEEEVSVNRRKILISLAELIRKGEITSKEKVVSEAIKKGLPEETSIKLLQEFEQRKVFKLENGIYRFVVKFFEDWLSNQGVEKIVATFEEEQRVFLQTKKNEELRVKSNELQTLADSWKSYKGKEITSEKISAWLNQFEGASHQRLMFKILQGIRFYSELVIREKMEAIFLEVQRQLIKNNIDRIVKDNKLKRSDILVSYLDKNPAKSGAEYAKKFVEINNIYYDNAIEPDKITEKLKDNDSIKTLVFVDDFVGTGKSLQENLEAIFDSHQNILAEKNILVVVGVIAGFQNVSSTVEQKLRKKGISLTIRILDPLNNSDKCFDDNSKILPSENERNEAKIICTEKGIMLEKLHPLGYGNCQSAIVFSNTCPNNSLPILWKKTKNWMPLFERE